MVVSTICVDGFKFVTTYDQLLDKGASRISVSTSITQMFMRSAEKNSFPARCWFNQLIYLNVSWHNPGTINFKSLLNFNLAKKISVDFIEWWCPRTDSNRGPIDYKSIALPAELQGHCMFFIIYSVLINNFFCFVYMKKNYWCAIWYIKAF